MTPLNFALKDAVKSVMPKVHPKKDYVAFAAVNVGSGFLAGLLALPVAREPVRAAQLRRRPVPHRRTLVRFAVVRARHVVVTRMCVPL